MICAALSFTHICRALTNLGMLWALALEFLHLYREKNMSAKLLFTGGQPGVISASDMEDGDIGVIITWGGVNQDSIGSIVQRYKDVLVQFGKRSGLAWEDTIKGLGGDKSHKSTCMVRILKPGELIEVV